MEVTLVMPSQTPGKESSGGDAESVIPDSASLGDDLHISNWRHTYDSEANSYVLSPSLNLDNSATWSSQAPPSLDQIKSNQQNPYYFGSIETPSPITNDPPSDLAQYTSNPNTHGFNVQILSTPITTSPNTPIQQAASSRSKNRNSVTDSGFKELGSSMLTIKSFLFECKFVTRSFRLRSDVGEERIFPIHDVDRFSTKNKYLRRHERYRVDAKWY